MTCGSFLRTGTMADAQWRSSRRLVAALLLAASLFLAPGRVAGDIILDEFLDPATAAEIVQPPFSPDYVETPSIGELNATRQIRIALGSTDPIARFDIGVTSPGQLTAEIDEIRRTTTMVTPRTAVQFNYAFEPTDVTEGGRNDAILFDFVELVGDVQPTFLRALVGDATTVGAGEFELFPLVANGSPHTLAMPLDSFTRRGGSPGALDPTTLRAVLFDFFFWGHEGELNWGTRIERIRFGRIVPEPDAFVLSCVGIVAWFWKGGRRCRSSGGTR